ncbi:MAG: hypothetical protein M5U09_28115 [Gammaproteobacteria bacterium]|nr:hypothetical protein [Gammaproteobacteria bacterium]
MKYTYKDDPLFGAGFYDMVLSPARYDRAEVRADFQAMRALGFEHRARDARDVRRQRVHLPARRHRAHALQRVPRRRRRHARARV